MVHRFVRITAVALVLHFEIPSLVDNGDLARVTEELILNGETDSGVPIRGSDPVMVVGR